ncbi:DUF4352 domain-containing protein [Leuconostoc mesenteroides]
MSRKNIQTRSKNKNFYQGIWIATLIIVIVAIIGLWQVYSRYSGDLVKKVDTTSAKKTLKPQSIFKVGETAAYKDIQFKVNDFNFIDGYPKIDKLTAGNQFVVINMTITNKSNKKFDYDAYFFHLDDDGQQTDTTESSYNVTDSLDSGTLRQGESTTGNLVGQANTNHQLKLIYQQDINLNKGKITFKLNQE